MQIIRNKIKLLAITERVRTSLLIISSSSDDQIIREIDLDTMKFNGALKIIVDMFYYYFFCSFIHSVIPS